MQNRQKQPAIPGWMRREYPRFVICMHDLEGIVTTRRVTEEYISRYPDFFKACSRNQRCAFVGKLCGVFLRIYNNRGSHRKVWYNHYSHANAIPQAGVV
jgi:hypothetical protein